MYFDVFHNPQWLVINAMKFAIPSEKVAREHNIRIVVNKIQDRLEEVDMTKFIVSLEALK